MTSAPPPSAAAPQAGGADVLLWAPEDFANLCMVLRTLDVLGIQRCFVVDPHGLVRPRYGKSNRRRINNLSAGAFERVELVSVAEWPEFLSTWPGRSVATVPEAAAPLESFHFMAGDLLVFGAESSGLPPQVLERCSHRTTIPQRGRTQSLNLAVAAGVVVYQAQLDCGVLGAASAAGLRSPRPHAPS